MVGIPVSFWDGLFSGAILVSGRVIFVTGCGLQIHHLLSWSNWTKNQGFFKKPSESRYPPESFFSHSPYKRLLCELQKSTSKNQKGSFRLQQWFPPPHLEKKKEKTNHPLIPASNFFFSIFVVFFAPWGLFFWFVKATYQDDVERKRRRWMYSHYLVPWWLKIRRWSFHVMAVMEDMDGHEPIKKVRLIFKSESLSSWMIMTHILLKFSNYFIKGFLFFCSVCLLGIQEKSFLSYTDTGVWMCCSFRAEHGQQRCRLKHSAAWSWF